MIPNNFEIGNLLRSTFGIGPVFILPEDAPQRGEAAYINIPVKSNEESKKLSWLGTPIMHPVLFKGTTYQQFAKTGKIEKVTLNDFDLPPASIIDFRRSKNVTKTRLSGNNGTVKEIYAFDDWQIRIRGLCLDDPKAGITAYQQQQELLKWENLADSIRVFGDYFTDKSIYDIVIEDINLPQREGSTNILPFVITAVSDEPLELIL